MKGAWDEKHPATLLHLLKIKGYIVAKFKSSGIIGSVTGFDDFGGPPAFIVSAPWCFASPILPGM